MPVSINFLLRLAGMVLFAYLGRALGTALSTVPEPTESEQLATNLLTLAGSGLGLLTMHRLVLEPLDRIRERARTSSIHEVLLIGFGVLIGLIFSALITFPLSQLPSIFGQVMPTLAVLLFSYLGGIIFAGRRREIYELIMRLRRQGVQTAQRSYLIDTSTIIDGRIYDIVRIGFLDGTLIVPRFVLHELHLLSDSADLQKRTRGKRGLEILSKMQRELPAPVEITPEEVEQVRTVDEKLIVLAKERSWPIITNDYNLNRVAEVENVQVLNVNQLADAVRLPITSGDQLMVEVREEGREREQGVGYLDDGTMVVIEDARTLLGQEVPVIVSRVWQTERGRMIFGRLLEQKG